MKRNVGIAASRLARRSFANSTRPTHARAFDMMQVKLFRADKTEALEAEVNAWLKANGDKIDVEHTQTVTGPEFNRDAEPGAVYVISIWYYEITKR
jgi:acetamidase/formamidase